MMARFIANNRQIENGIVIELSDAVKNSNEEQNALLREILKKETGISKNDMEIADQSWARDYLKRTGRSAYSQIISFYLYM